MQLRLKSLISCLLALGMISSAYADHGAYYDGRIGYDDGYYGTRSVVMSPFGTYTYAYPYEDSAHYYPYSEGINLSAVINLNHPEVNGHLEMMNNEWVFVPEY